MTNPVVPRRYLPIFAALVSCFALWGVLNNMTDNLVPAFQKIFMTSQSTAGYVQISFYGAYSVVALFASLLVQKAGYRFGVLVGLGVYVLGALLYVPACVAQSFWLYIAGIFIVAGGCAVLETTCNPYVLALGSPETAVRRLNFAQMFNPVGSLAGILLAQQLILANLHPATADERAAMAPEALKAIMNRELFWVCVPYVGLCAIAALIWFFFYFSKRTEADAAETGRTDFRAILSILAHSPSWYLGVVAQVFYVGVQIMCWTFIIQYADHLGINKATAQLYNIAAMSLNLGGRFIGTFIMRYVNTRMLLTIFGVGASLCTLGAISIEGMGGLYCLVAISLFMSIMFPSIYGIALENVDTKDTHLGAAFLVMAIVGGALMPPMQGRIIDMGTLWGMPAVNMSFILPLICFLVIIVYGWRAYMKRG